MITGKAVEYLRALKSARVRGEAGVDEADAGATKIEG